jgi:PAS domain S-box-containing protein
MTEGEKIHSGQADDLLRRALEVVRAKAHTLPDTPTPDQSKRLYQELQVHQIELEMQNEELRRARDELEAERERYFDLYDLAPIGYLTINGKGLILEANLMAAALLGAARGSLVKQSLTRFILPEDHHIFSLHCKLLFETGAPQVCELRVLRQDGAQFWVGMEAKVAMQDGEDGAPVCRAMIRDITERKQMEETQLFLLQSGYADENFFDLLARYLARSLAMDYVCIDRLLGDGLTAQTVSVYFDGKFEDNVAYALKDTPCGAAVGKMICCFPKEVRHLFSRDVVLQEMVAESYVGTTLWSSKGQPKPIGLIAVIGRKQLLNPRLAESILKLVAVRAAGELERREAEMVLKERTLQLEYLNQELESFSYSISHDLKAPLRAIDGFSRMIVQKYGDKLAEEGTRLFNTIRSNAQMMNRLIDDLLSFSRVSRKDMNMTEIDMASLAGGVWNEIRAAYPDRELDVKVVKILPGFGDQALVRQVLLNLFSNAVKFTGNRKPGIIEMDSYTESDTVVYRLKDNGVGFDMRYYDKLFGVFQRLHSAEEFEGTGVGLATAKRIINRHGGKVWAEGEVDKGAIFYFSLPRGVQQSVRP